MEKNTDRSQFLEVVDVSKSLGNTAVLNQLSFTQNRFNKTAIAGETGAGKSTLLKIIAGLEQPDAGKVFFEGKKVTGPLETLIPGHPGIAYLSQYFELRNNYRVEELLEYANRLSEAEAEKLFSVCRIDHLLKRKVDQVSGGERQRVALARLLTGSPRLLLLDEPFSNLDPIHKNLLKQVLHDIGEKLQITCILTSHDPFDTLSWADEILVMRAGRIIQQGSPQKIYNEPIDAYAAGLFGSYTFFDEKDASVFPGINTNHFIRPERWRLPGASPDAVPGTVNSCRFWGSYYETEVIVSGKSIITRTDEAYEKGNAVWLSLK